MNRRACLATLAGGAWTSLAGCSALGDETVLGAPTERRDGRSVYYEYTREGEAALRVTFHARPQPPRSLRLRAYVEQPGDTVLASYRFRFRPATTAEPAPEVYLRPPMVGQADDFATYRDGGWTVVAGEYEDPRRVTTRVGLLVSGDGQRATALPPLVAEYEVVLSGPGALTDTMVARDRQSLEFEPPG